jgi:predicted amidophosphoribosyltransferase
MSFIVKNTTICSLFDMICPHSCRGCGAIGSALCNCCKNNIILKHLDFCPNCQHPTQNGFCADCYLPPLFAVGPRGGLLRRLIHDYKYHQVRSLAMPLAEILNQTLPVFAGEVSIVPLPTIRRHIRERGFDHILLLAKKLAKLRGYNVVPLLSRDKNFIQVGADKETRKLQAAEAYIVTGAVEPDTTYLLIDDVWTTGASMKAALKKLQGAGAFKLAGAVLAVS